MRRRADSCSDIEGCNASVVLIGCHVCSTCSNLCLKHRRNISHVLWETVKKRKSVWCCGMSSDVTWSKVVCSERRINSKYYSLWESYQPQLAVFAV